MKFSIKVESLNADNVNLNGLNVELEYTPDELAELLKHYPSIINQVTQLMKEAKR